MKYLYYCNSTYQILNALNLNWQRKHAGFENIINYSSDIVILNVFPDAKKTAELIKKGNHFSNIYLINRVKNKGKLHLLKTIYGIIDPNFFLKRAGIEKPSSLKGKYDCIVVPKFSKGSAAIWQLNKKAILQLYEDGYGSYDGKTLMESLVPSNKTYKYLYTFFNYGRRFEHYSKLYLNEKNMFHNGKMDRVIQTPKINEGLLNEIKDIFSHYDSVYKNKKLIWFGQPIDEDNIINTKKVLINYRDDVIYKPHPRYGGNIDDFDTVKKPSVWEVDVLSTKDINKKCLITCNSTAVFTPKILFNFEPYVIFTFNILGKKEENDVLISKSFLNIYKDKKKILIPNSVEEFYKSINKYYENTN